MGEELEGTSRNRSACFNPKMRLTNSLKGKITLLMNYMLECTKNSHFDSYKRDQSFSIINKTVGGKIGCCCLASGEVILKVGLRKKYKSFV